MDGRPDGIQMTQFRVVRVRGRPQSCGGVCGGVFPDDFGKYVRVGSLRCVRE